MCTFYLFCPSLFIFLPVLHDNEANLTLQNKLSLFNFTIQLRTEQIYASNTFITYKAHLMYTGADTGFLPAEGAQ